MKGFSYDHVRDVLSTEGILVIFKTDENSLRFVIGLCRETGPIVYTDVYRPCGHRVIENRNSWLFHKRKEYQLICFITTTSSSLDNC